MAEALLQTIDLTKHFRIGGMFGARLHALDDVSLRIDAGEIVAVVGESGSGKSTLARLLAKVFRPSGGDILFRGKSLAQIRSRRELLVYRGQVPMVFQDPFSALNPVHTIGYTLGRVLALHQPGLSATAREDAAVAALEDVGLSPARQTLAKYPHELSGGQRQRVGFAQALACGPKLILADEPVSMLDVSIRIGLLNLMARLRDEAGISLLYITHDIASARYVSDRVLVMYAGQVVESGAAEAVLREPLHPYTRLLLSAVPDPAMAMTLDETEPGEPPRVINPGPGCRFRFRCRLAINICAAETPPLAGPPEGHQAACHVTVTQATAR